MGSSEHMRWVHYCDSPQGPIFWCDAALSWTRHLAYATRYRKQEHPNMITYERAEAEWAAANI
jgi:hypothetical protein